MKLHVQTFKAEISKKILSTNEIHFQLRTKLAEKQKSSHPISLDSESTFSLM